MKRYFMLSRNGFIGIICAISLTFLLLGSLKTSVMPKVKDGAANTDRVNYLLSLGYKVNETPVSVKETIVPTNFGAEFKEYLKLQTESGFALCDYLGEQVTIYEYKTESGSVTLIVTVQGVIIGGHATSDDYGNYEPLKKDSYMETIRIDKMLSNACNVSRSDVRKLIRRGEVTVDGRTVKTFDEKINPESCEVRLKGQLVGYKEFVYIMLNKPKGILSASNDKSRKTVVDLVPDEMKRQKLVPVGRLDKDTTGLLIITNDGEYAHKIISPKNKSGKVYVTTLDGVLKEELIEEFSKGVVLADGTKCRPAKLEILEPQKARLTLFDGKYHEVKRMFGVFDLGVVELHREAIGNLVLPENLESGKCLIMSEEDVEKTL